METNGSKVYKKRDDIKYVIDIPEGYTFWTVGEECIIFVNPNEPPRIFDLNTKRWLELKV